MQIREGAQVLTADGEQAGKVDRVVLDPNTKEVTHLVVQKGLLFAQDKVVPLSLIGSTTEDQVTLSEGAGDLEELPDFEESHYVQADRGIERGSDPDLWARPLYWYPPILVGPINGGYADRYIPPYVEKTEKNIPEGTVALEAGAKVIASDEEKVGDIERIFVDSQEERATHLLISKGLLFKEKKLIPTVWISRVLEDDVHLSVDSKLVDDLPEYQPEH